ncbi:uncharacterized protein A4U43_C06F15600 [Asparagus officinalis]|uniref:Uncharacterized protein n=1 Tax=Asparagus officinalis TaxID=4686 RepID=A0A5P1ER98_ASPOF|nr:uncharacterized protein A4U43_C06F15600 [Asparagus officinalis]
MLPSRISEDEQRCRRRGRARAREGMEQYGVRVELMEEKEGSSAGLVASTTMHLGRGGWRRRRGARRGWSPARLCIWAEEASRGGEQGLG